MARRSPWTRAARDLARARVEARLWLCPRCRRKSLARWAYRTDPPRMVRICKFCYATDE